MTLYGAVAPCHGFVVRSGSDENGTIGNVRASVTTVNANIEAFDLQFVMVLGDLTDSAEMSEYVMAKSILDELDASYFPVIGNHDMWPYVRTGSEGFEEASLPIGDRYFVEVFDAHFAALGTEFPSLVEAPTPSHNPEHDIESHFVNYAFEYLGYRFVVLDLVTRTHAWEGYPGIGPEGALHDFEGGTWRWFTDYLEEHGGVGQRDILVFCHHPPIRGIVGLPDEDYYTVRDYIIDNEYGDDIYGFFAGHLHFELIDTLFDGQQVIVTDAAKEESTVRVVQVFSDGTIDYHTLL